MKPPRFEYHVPRALDEALALLASRGDRAKVLAGGQSLIPLLNFRLAHPEALVDINRIGDLAYVRANGDGLAIGALTRQHAVERSEIVRARAPILAEACRFIGHLPIRHRGTIGGSLAHADPASELPAAMVALEAQLTLASDRGRRTVSVESFFVGPLTTALGPGELLVEVRVPDPPRRTGGAFVEMARRAGDFALVGVAALRHARRGRPLRARAHRPLRRGAHADPRASGRGRAAGRNADRRGARRGGEPCRRRNEPAVGRARLGGFPQEARPPLHPRGHRDGRRARDKELSMPTTVPITLAVNGIRHELNVEPRWLLVDVIRDALGLTGTHIGCEHGVCGTCTVLLDGETVTILPDAGRRCRRLARSSTVEGLGRRRRANPLQEAFREHRACSAASARRAC